ncbi:hypothetical protein U9M48_032949 [Paspalum notatum var. saurae]|uniref:Reverse transcriptase Ty1/copia-type domain-containing protein n=1 Tax=Paspalum notatum var. saurae TaxID=547442 RepID=A0AAQ3U6C2_PASNO
MLGFFPLSDLPILLALLPSWSAMVLASPSPPWANAGTNGPFRLPNVLVAPHMVHNLLSIRQFTNDNSCSVEFDSSGLTVKDSATRRPLLRCDSSGPLYTLRFPPSAAPSTSPSHSSSAAFAITTSSTTWHRRLGHPALRLLMSISVTRASWAATVQLRMSCPYTSPQNGKAERMIRTTNDSLHTATYLLNRLPSTASPAPTPHHALFGTPPRCNHLRVFGCTCYPNTSATAPHKLAPRSTRCVFLGYSPDHKGYRCFDLTTRRVLISRHVVFDESDFPFSTTSTPASNLELESLFPTDPVVQPPLSERSSGPPLAYFLDARPRFRWSLLCHARPRSSLLRRRLPLRHARPRRPRRRPRRHARPRRLPHATHSPACLPTPSDAPPGSGTTTSGVSGADPVFDTACGAAAARATSPPSSRLSGILVTYIPMVTRRVAGVLRPAALSTAAEEPRISPVPSSVRDALADPHWRRAMEEEYAALLANQTWDLVPRPPGGNVVTGKWIWTHKRRADGTLDRYKARWVLRGFTQRPGVDYDETFSPVVKPATVRTVLSLALSRSWPVHQLNVKNAFLHGTLTETSAGGVCGSRSPRDGLPTQQVYGLKQAPRASYSRFATFLVTLRFTEAKSDTSLFVYRHGDETAYLLLYVNDIVLTASSQHLLQRIITSMQQEFATKDLGVLHHFLGVTIEPRPSGLLLHQRQYTLDILERAEMTDCNPCSTPVDTQAKLPEDVGTPVADPTAYRSLAGALQYLTFTRPDITYAVQQVCLHMHDLREPHLTALKRLLRYLRGTVDYGLLLHRSIVYTDADWAGCPDTRRSTSDYAVFLGGNLVSWSAEAEYRAVANGVAEASWLRQLLAELHSPLATRTLVYCDNVSAVYLSTNPVQHQRTKHVEIVLHFVRDFVAIGAVRVLHVPTTSQFADIFTKGLPSTTFAEFRSSLNINRG